MSCHIVYIIVWYNSMWAFTLLKGNINNKELKYEKRALRAPHHTTPHLRPLLLLLRLFFALRMPRGFMARVMGLIPALFFIAQTLPAQAHSGTNFAGSQRQTLSIGQACMTVKVIFAIYTVYGI